jgi:hypothetical protein
MTGRKWSRVHLNNPISRSQALAHLAQNEMNQCTIHAPEEDNVEKAQGDEEGDLCGGPFEFEAFDSDSSESSSPEERFPSGDLPAGDSHTAEEQLHVVLGGNFQDEQSHLAEDDEENIQEAKEDGQQFESVIHRGAEEWSC